MTTLRVGVGAESLQTNADNGNAAHGKEKLPKNVGQNFFKVLVRK